MTTVKNIYDYLNKIAPFDSQEPWDNSGFLVGDFRQEVKKVVFSLDITKEVVAFASDLHADLIISHHPVIFGGITDVKSGSVVHSLIKNNISAICAHTNLDKAKDGINDELCNILQIKNTYVMDNGFVRIGEIENVMSIDDFAEFVSNKLDCHSLRFTDTDKDIKKVAVCSGSGDNEFIVDAMNEADVFLTGDLKYHEMLDAQQMGFSVISAGHFETEFLPATNIFKKLEKIFIDVEFYNSNQINPIMEI